MEVVPVLPQTRILCDEYEIGRSGVMLGALLLAVEPRYAASFWTLEECGYRRGNHWTARRKGTGSQVSPRRDIDTLPQFRRDELPVSSIRRLAKRLTAQASVCRMVWEVRQMSVRLAWDHCSIVACRTTGLRAFVIDPEVYHAIQREQQRERNHLELIASENFVSQAVMAAQGCVMTTNMLKDTGHRYYAAASG